MKINYLAFIVFLLFYGTVFSQEELHSKTHSYHTLGFTISHTQISQGIQANGDKEWLSLPSWAIGLGISRIL